MKKLYCDNCSTEIRSSENVIENRLRRMPLKEDERGVTIIFDVRCGFSPNFDRGELCVKCLCLAISEAVKIYNKEKENQDVSTF